MQAQIARAATALGLNLNDMQTQALANYLALLHKWNAAYNLSALKSIDDMLVKHLFDCLAVVQPIAQRIADYKTKTILDVGTGAGLPGIVLAVCLPQAQITMLDAVQKKIIFVRQAIGTLGLTNAQAHGTRIQDWQQTHSMITARAWTALADIPTLTAHCLARGGCIAAMKGPRLSAEAETLPSDWVMTEVLEIAVPQLEDPRSLAILHRKTD
jgi:16S rRNA (guanine527-N7)-methyltransferase